MKLATPRWWYVRRGAPMPLTRALLTPISWVWALVTARRIAAGRPIDPGVPVICVGNLTVGGTGKTPVVRALVRRLGGTGETQILTRGYGGRMRGPLLVAPSLRTTDDVGDEALMLTADAPVWVARDRAAGALAAAAGGASVIVMDDGHQNPAVKKTLSLVVVDGETRDGEWPFGDGAVFPAGPMREPLALGLARADAVVLLMPADLETPDPALVALFSPKPVLIARLVPSRPPPPGPQLAFAGIGKPWKMERATWPTSPPWPTTSATTNACSASSPTAPKPSAPASSPARKTGSSSPRPGGAASPPGRWKRASRTRRR
jgi:tetraacyldisaccharide 4'-kinase